LDDALNIRRRLRLAGARKPPAHARAGARLVSFGKLDAENAAGAPGDGAGSDGRIEQRESRFRHDLTLTVSRRMSARLGESCAVVDTDPPDFATRGASWYRFGSPFKQ